MRAIRAAAVVYASSSVGEIVSEPAMLSKPLRRIVRRQQRRDVDVEIQQVADRIRVFGAVQPMEDDGPGLMRAAALRSISASSQSRSPSYSASGGRCMSGGGITPARSLRTTFSQNFGVIAGGGQIEFFQRKIGRLQSVVVAGDAVLIEQRAFCRGRGGCWRYGSVGLLRGSQRSRGLGCRTGFGSAR